MELVKALKTSKTAFLHFCVIILCIERRKNMTIDVRKKHKNPFEDDEFNTDLHQKEEFDGDDLLESEWG